MKNRMLLFGLLLSLAVFTALGTKASAQFEALGGNNWNARVGIFFPSTEDARDAEGDTWFTAGAEWRFFSQVPVAGQVLSNVTLSVDWYGSGDLYAIPVLVNYRGEIDRFFFTAGIGIAFNKDFDNDTGTDIAWQIGAGFNLVEGPLPVYTMLRYHDAGAEGLDGFSLVVGLRF